MIAGELSLAQFERALGKGQRFIILALAVELQHFGGQLS